MCNHLESGFASLEYRVAAQAVQGFEPIGGVSVTRTSSRPYPVILAQAMVRRGFIHTAPVNPNANVTSLLYPSNVNRVL